MDAGRIIQASVNKGLIKLLRYLLKNVKTAPTVPESSKSPSSCSPSPKSSGQLPTVDAEAHLQATTCWSPLDPLKRESRSLPLWINQKQTQNK
jgi:hypothetical protein